MPGLVPGIYVLRDVCKDADGESGLDDAAATVLPKPAISICFIIFVDRMFTTFIAGVFTNTSDVMEPKRERSCV